MHIPDLTEKTYESWPNMPYPGVFCGETVQSVGYLAEGYPYSKGSVSQELIDKLRALSTTPIVIPDGVHECDLCDLKQRSSLPFSIRTGAGEIRVRAADGVIFEAPVLILHYIQAHQYRPPNAFLEALASM